MGEIQSLPFLGPVLSAVLSCAQTHRPEHPVSEEKKGGLGCSSPFNPAPSHLAEAHDGA